MKWIGRPVAEISPLEIFPAWRWPPSWICSNRKLRRSIRRPRKPYPRTKHEVDRITVAEIWPFAYVGGIWNPVFWGEDCRGSAMALLGRAMVVSYTLSIVTVALSVTIRPQFAIECLRRSNQQGWVTLGPNLGGVPLGADPPCWGCNERKSQAN